jgi:hypothetical protein
MNRLDKAKAYAAAAYKRNKEELCNCAACQAIEQAETLAKVQRIIAARAPVKREARVYRISRSK